MEKELGKRRYSCLGGEGPFLVDKYNGDLYYTYSFASIEWFVKTFEDYKFTGKDSTNLWRKLN
ncbi:MAG: hypothetical protein GY810_28055 [Aureispira sp.]|nr:hypothetical protein [Aureispira sp.]